MPVPGRALNLVALARSAAGEAVAVPGGPMDVQELLTPRSVQGATDRWVLVLRGEVIVDFPGGDFRVLRQGDALALPAGSAATLRSVAAPAILAWHAAR